MQKRQPSTLAEANSYLKLKLFDETGKVVYSPVSGITYNLELSIDKLVDVSSVIFELNLPANTELADYTVLDDFKFGANDFIEFIRQDGQTLTVVLARPVIYGAFSGNDVKLIRFTLKISDDLKAISIADPRIMDKNGTFYKIKFDEKSINAIPDKFNLAQNYPNPFNPKTIIKFDLPEDAKVSLRVYNMLGELVHTLIESEILSAGSYEREFDASYLPSGVYVYRLSSDKFTATRKMVLMK